MTAEQVRELIELEVAGDWSLTNAHGCDLRRCLVPPLEREYDDRRAGQPLVEPPPVIRLWLVLEELPEDRSGYKIVYGEEARMFGLAVPGITRDVFIGYYGRFLDTYRGM
jgi:hypothetical protein